MFTFVFLYTEPGMVAWAVSNPQEQVTPKTKYSILQYELTGYYYHLHNKQL